MEHLYMWAGGAVRDISAIGDHCVNMSYVNHIVLLPDFDYLVDISVELRNPLNTSWKDN